MNYRKFYSLHSLISKKVALFGSTGGIGQELCKHVLELGCSLILINRNIEKTLAQKEMLLSAYKGAQIEHITADLEDIESVKNAAEQIKKLGADIIIHNAGAYSIPRKKCSTGFDNVFQINFLSPYFLTRLLIDYLKEKRGSVIFVSSIAHNYSKTDPDDIDFSRRTKNSFVYGNAKRYLMFSAFDLAEQNPEIKIAVTHPGITFTNITAHYPKLIFAIIKHPMKIIFMKPKKAALSILSGAFESTQTNEWIGPRFFDIWGTPRKKLLKTCSQTEMQRIQKDADEIFKTLIK